MKVAVVNNTVPFLRGGAEILADSLCERLTMAGHDATLVRLPFSWEPPLHIADAMLAASLTTIAEVDRVVALKFPAYMVPHDDKVVWLLHQFRQFYDLWTEGGHDDETVAVRDLVLRADDLALGGARRLFANSAVTATRLRRFNGLHAEVLHPPLPNPEAFGDAGTGDYVFAGGRINSFKRQLLAVEAMCHVVSDVQLIVAGAPESPADLEELEAARARCPRPERVVIIPRFIAEHHKVELVNHALACVYAPIDEDSYGYVTLEGAQASKALITTTDSGGILELVQDGRSGVVCTPDPREMASAFDRLYMSRAIAAELGRGAHQRMLELGISWEHVLSRLLAA